MTVPCDKYPQPSAVLRTWVTPSRLRYCLFRAAALHNTRDNKTGSANLPSYVLTFLQQLCLGRLHPIYFLLQTFFLDSLKLLLLIFVNLIIRCILTKNVRPFLHGKFLLFRVLHFDEVVTKLKLWLIYELYLWFVLIFTIIPPTFLDVLNHLEPKTS